MKSGISPALKKSIGCDQVVSARVPRNSQQPAALLLLLIFFFFFFCLSSTVRQQLARGTPNPPPPAPSIPSYAPPLAFFNRFGSSFWFFFVKYFFFKTKSEIIDSVIITAVYSTPIFFFQKFKMNYNICLNRFTERSLANAIDEFERLDIN